MFHWCSLSLIVAAILWYVLRKAIRIVTSNDDLILYVDEFSGNIFSGVFIMELGVIVTHHGTYSVPHFALGFIMLYIRNIYFSFESVSSFVDSYYSNGRKITFTFVHFAVNVLLQIAGLVIGQYLARFFWAFEDHTHTDALSYACETAISSDHGSMSVAFAEFLGVFTMCVAAYFVPENKRNLVPLVVTTVAYINFFFFTHVSGSFYNQAMSTAFTFQCKGHRGDLEFFFVYWVSPTVGSFAAWETLSLLTGKSEEKVEKTE